MPEEQDQHTQRSENDRGMIMSEHPSQIQHSRLGPILAVLAVILVLILGGLYLWGSVLTENEQEPPSREVTNNEPETPRSEADAQILETLSPSDELSAIEADLESTNLEGLDSGLDTIDQELDAAIEAQ